jgi:hypothetical protein
MSLVSVLRQGSRPLCLLSSSSRLQQQGAPTGLIGRHGGRRKLFSSEKHGNGSSMTSEERQEAIRKANESMKGYVETRILAKQGKLKSKRGESRTTASENAIQRALFLSLAAAFIASPFLGKKIAQDKEFREKYVPAWWDFTVKAPASAWTRKELHEQIVQVESEMRERALRGEFTPEKLEMLKHGLEPRQDLSEEDNALAKKFGWNRIHPGIVSFHRDD